MRTFARYLAFACAVALGCGASSAEVSRRRAEAPGRRADGPVSRVIRSDEIREAGITRLADIVFLLDDWAPSTIDGFSWEMAPPGGAGEPFASWVVLVDGIRVDTDRFGFSSANLIPVRVGEIDSIEVETVPALREGEFAPSGLLHIHTRQDRPGAGAGGTASTGNESGDPGPYAYTEYATPNVDRIGPDYSAYGEYGTDAAFARAAVLRHRQYPTDEAVRARNFGISAGDYPQMTLVTGGGAIGAGLLGGTHRAFAAGSRFDDYFFFKPYGREIPVLSRSATGGLAGNVPVAENARIEYRASYTRREIDRRRNALDLDFDWTNDVWRGSADVSFDNAGWRQRYGAGFESATVKTGYALTQGGYDLATVYGEWEVFALDAHSQDAAVRLTAGEGDVALEAAVAERWRLGPAHRIDLVASYVETPPERDRRIWYWDERGYRFLEDAGVDVVRGEPLGTARRWSADAAWSSQFGERFAGSATAYYRHSANLVLEEQRFEFDPDEQAFGGPVRLVSDQDGGVAGAAAVFEARPARGVFLRSYYRFEKAVTGEELFRSRCDAVPRHLFRQTASYAPVPGFTLWARLNYMSAAAWHDYEDAERDTGGRYRTKVDPFVTIDAAAVKWLWERRLKASVLFRDLLRQSPRYHPIGAAFDTSLFVEIELNLGSR